MAVTYPSVDDEGPLYPVRRGRPLHSVFTPFPAVCFTLALFTDVAYWRSGGNILWQNFSAWLLFAGLVFGGLAIVFALVGRFARKRGREPVRWLPVALGLVAMLLAVLNSFVHAGDGWTAVVPWGLALSVLTVVVLLIVPVFDRPRPLRPGVSRYA